MEKLAFYYPRLMREILGSRDTVSDWEEDKFDTMMELAVPVILVSALGIPVTLTTGPPALAARGWRNLKKGMSGLFGRRDEDRAEPSS